MKSGYSWWPGRIRIGGIDRNGVLAQPRRQAAERTAERERERPSGCELTLEEIALRLAIAMSPLTRDEIDRRLATLGRGPAPHARG